MVSFKTLRIYESIFSQWLFQKPQKCAQQYFKENTQIKAVTHTKINARIIFN